MEITREEMQTMINAAVERNLDERRKNQNRITKMLDQFTGYFEKFNFTEHITQPRYDGTTIEKDVDKFHAHNVRTAILMLLRAHFRVDNVSKISAEKDGEVIEFVNSILSVSLPKEVQQ